jgi:hypothetical protein
MARSLALVRFSATSVVAFLLVAAMPASRGYATSAKELPWLLRGQIDDPDRLFLRILPPCPATDVIHRLFGGLFGLHGLLLHPRSLRSLR